MKAFGPRVEILDRLGYGLQQSLYGLIPSRLPHQMNLYGVVWVSFGRTLLEAIWLRCRRGNP